MTTETKPKITTRGRPTIGKDELHIAEYPLTIVSERLPHGVVAVEYNDWRTLQNGKRVRVIWRLHGSGTHGLPTAADQDVLVVLLKLAYDSKIETPRVEIGSAYQYLKLLGWPGAARRYRRLKKSLDRYIDATVHAQNIVWDRQKNQLRGNVAFNVIDHYKLFDIRERGSRQGTAPLPLGHVELGRFFFQLMQQGSLKDLDLSFYCRLPNPLTRRLYRYLDKKRYNRQTFSRNIYHLGGHLGLIGTNLTLYKLDETKRQTVDGPPPLVRVPVNRYWPSQVKRLLMPSLEILKTEGFLDSYTFNEGKSGPYLTVCFAGWKELKVPEGAPPELAAIADKVNRAAREKEHQLLQEILALTGDQGSTAYYTKVVHDLEEQTIYEIISSVRQAQRGNPLTNPAKLFTHLAQQRRQGRVG